MCYALEAHAEGYFIHCVPLVDNRPGTSSSTPAWVPGAGMGLVQTGAFLTVSPAGRSICAAVRASPQPDSHDAALASRNARPRSRCTIRARNDLAPLERHGSVARKRVGHFVSTVKAGGMA